MRDSSATRPARVGLGAKIFVAATLSIAAVLGVTLGLTTVQADRTADQSIRRALAGVRRGVQAFLSGRTATFMGMSGVSAEVPQFRERLLKSAERSNVLDQAAEYRQLLGAAWVVVPLRASPGAVPQCALVASYAIDDTLAQQIKQATTTDVVFFALDTLARPYVVGSTLPRDEVEPALAADTAALRRFAGDSSGAEVSAIVGGQHMIGLASPIRSAGGDAFGGFVAFRSHERELAAFAALRRTLAVAFVLGLALALVSAYVLARQIAGPIRRLALATRRVQDGDYSVEIDVRSADEIGVLSAAFSGLVADLKEKANLVEYMMSASQAASTAPLRGEGAAGHRRDGSRVSGVRSRAAGAGGDQDAPARGARGRWRGAGALQARDPPGAQDHSSQRGPHVRPGRDRRHLLSHDGVRRGHSVEAADHRARPAPGSGHAHDRQAVVPRARGGARAGRDPPRHQAAEHRGRAERVPQGDGLRHRPPRQPPAGERPDPGRHVDRYARLHVAGAAVGHGARRAQRSLFDGSGAVRVPHAARAVRGGHRLCADREAPGGAAARSPVV